MTDADPNAWRALIATLANDTARRVYAEFVVSGESATLGTLPPSRRRHLLRSLTASGLIESADGMLRVNPAVFAEALRAAPATPRRQGLDRFLDDVGRIHTYPADAGVRTELLAAVARQAFTADEVLTEREVNARLERYTDDVAVLRRYLVDAGELERTRSGSQYARSHVRQERRAEHEKGGSHREQ